jgi:hypothetical protein
MVVKSALLLAAFIELSSTFCYYDITRVTKEILGQLGFFFNLSTAFLEIVVLWPSGLSELGILLLSRSFPAIKLS